jgi:hypothetical protein
VALYSFRCPECGNEDDRIIPMAVYDAAAGEQRCTCGALMKRVFEPPLATPTGRWRDEVASVGPSEFMRREQFGRGRRP